MKKEGINEGKTEFSLLKTTAPLETRGRIFYNFCHDFCPVAKKKNFLLPCKIVRDFPTVTSTGCGQCFWRRFFFCCPTKTLKESLEGFSEGLWVVAQNQFLCS